MERLMTSESTSSSSIEIWKEKRAKAIPSLKFKQHSKKTAPKGKGHSGVPYPATYEHSAIPEIKPGMEDLYFATVSETTGVLNEFLGQQLISQAQFGSPYGKQLDVAAEAVAAALFEMKPKDAIEGMLVTQMTALHNQMMHYMRLSLEKDWEAEMNISRFTKLNRHFIDTLQTLLKYRNRGQQRVIVENVNVSEGGRAIIGHVESKGTAE